MQFTRFLKFGLVGIAGFLIDTAVLYACIYLGMGLYVGRLVSFLFAATGTWALNRRYTFDSVRNVHPGREWVEFVSVNSVGGVINYAVYAAMVSGIALVVAYPVLGVAAGSLAGWIFNFVGSSKLVFRESNNR